MRKLLKTASRWIADTKGTWFSIDSDCKTVGRFPLVRLNSWRILDHQRWSVRWMESLVNTRAVDRRTPSQCHRNWRFKYKLIKIEFLPRVFILKFSRIWSTFTMLDCTLKSCQVYQVLSISQGASSSHFRTTANCTVFRRRCQPFLPSNDEWTVVMTNYCARYVMHQAASVPLPGNNEEPCEPSVLNFIPTPTCRTRLHRRHPAIGVHVRRIWSLNERGEPMIPICCQWRPTFGRRTIYQPAGSGWCLIMFRHACCDM